MKPVEAAPPEAPPQWETLLSRAEEEAPLQGSAAHAPDRAARWKHGVRTAAVLVLAGAAGLAIQNWTQAPPPTQAELDSGRRALLALVNSSLERHLRLHGEYPEDLAVVLPIQVEVSYRRTSAGYEASVRMSDGQLVNVQKP